MLRVTFHGIDAYVCVVKRDDMIRLKSLPSTCTFTYSFAYLYCVQQPASSDTWRNVFFTMAGVLVVATFVFWITGSGQRQWWAIYVEMPSASTDVLPATATAASDAGTAPSDEKRNAEEQRQETTDRTKLDSARNIVASFTSQQQGQQPPQQQQQDQLTTS